MSPQTASIIGAALASGPGWAMFINNRRANRRHGERVEALHEKVDRLTPATPAGDSNDGGESP